MLLVASIVSACSASDSAASRESTPNPSEVVPATEAINGADVERRSSIGPHAADSERAMALAVDSIQVDGDDILLSLRVINDDDHDLAVGAEDTFYAPLVVLHDDLDNAYPARAVEPAGVYAHSVGHLDLRLEGPLDPDATEFTTELTTDRGTIETGPAELPTGDAVRWWVDENPTRGQPEFADLPHLPDLIHATISNDSLEKSTLAFDDLDRTDG
ncbi:hypothetical protein [Ilumatobacter nonamiensis]|uniref:hypothetical protein n=1 Tax=Ilumatobacter nonamiensis TaxID=467093 RepID=UPI00058E1770|nr:hypothetical protein [Ilumatobacter nonamiensis]